MALRQKRLVLDKNMLGTDYRGELDRKIEDSKKIQELGAKFESEKSTLEARLERIKGINLDNSQKAALLAEVQAKINELQQQYEQDVIAEQERIESELNEVAEQMDEAVAELDEEASAFGSMRMEGATDVNLGSVSDAITGESRRMKELKQNALQSISEINQALQSQHDSIRRRPN